MSSFSIQRLNAWSPRLSELEIKSTSQLMEINFSAEDKYQATLIPSTHSRRMSSLSKATVDIALKTTKDRHFDYAVFSTRYGELASTVSLVDSIQKKEDLSPTKFSQSVHNTSAGLFSIVSGSKVSMNSLSAGRNTFLSALLSAVSYVQSKGNATVLVVHSDEQVPSELFEFADEFERDPIVIALLISKNNGQAFKIEPEQLQNFSAPSSSQSLSFLHQIANSPNSIRLSHRNLSWKINAL